MCASGLDDTVKYVYVNSSAAPSFGVNLHLRTEDKC